MLLNRQMRMITNWTAQSAAIIWTWLMTSTAAPCQLLNQTSPPPLHLPPPSSRLSKGQLSSSCLSFSFFLVYWLSAASGSFWTRIAACHRLPGRTTWRRTHSITEFPDRQHERQQPWQNLTCKLRQQSHWRITAPTQIHTLVVLQTNQRHQIFSVVSNTVHQNQESRSNRVFTFNCIEFQIKI